MIKFFNMCLVVMMLMVLYGCSGEPTRKAPTLVKKQALMPADTLDVSRREALAKALYEENEIYESLTQWRILHTIDPQNAGYLNRIQALQALIDNRVNGYLSKGKNALTVGNRRQAKSYLFKALALDPTNDVAMKTMRKIEYTHVERVQMAITQRLMRKQQRKFTAEQARKKRQQSDDTMVSDDDEQPEKEASDQEKFYLEMGTMLFKKGDWNGTIREIDKYLSSNKSTPSIDDMLMKAHTNMSVRFEKRGHWEPAILQIELAINYASNHSEVKTLMAKHHSMALKAAGYYYSEGVKVYRTDLNRAIEYWKQALVLNPQLLQAKARLEKARKVKQNLQAMEH